MIDDDSKEYPTYVFPRSVARNLLLPPEQGNQPEDSKQDGAVNEAIQKISDERDAYARRAEFFKGELEKKLNLPDDARKYVADLERMVKSRYLDFDVNISKYKERIYRLERALEPFAMFGDHITKLPKIREEKGLEPYQINNGVFYTSFISDGESVDLRYEDALFATKVLREFW
jgi:hypothetical protein